MDVGQASNSALRDTLAARQSLAELLSSQSFDWVYRGCSAGGEINLVNRDNCLNE